MRAGFPTLLALALLGALPARADSGFASLARRRETPPPAQAQSREYETPDLLRARRLAIAALQDLGFALESADSATGAITASRLDGHPLRLAVTVAAAGEASVTASVTTEYAGTPSADARAADAFFASYAAALNPPPEIDW